MSIFFESSPASLLINSTVITLSKPLRIASPWRDCWYKANSCWKASRSRLVSSLKMLSVSVSFLMVSLVSFSMMFTSFSVIGEKI